LTFHNKDAIIYTKFLEFLAEARRKDFKLCGFLLKAGFFGNLVY